MAEEVIYEDLELTGSIHQTIHDLGVDMGDDTPFTSPTDNGQEMINPSDNINEVNEFFYIDVKKYVYKNRKQINQKIKGLSYRKKVEFLESIIRSLNVRGYQIKTAVDWEKFKVGL